MFNDTNAIFFSRLHPLRSFMRLPFAAFLRAPTAIVLAGQQAERSRDAEVRCYLLIIWCLKALMTRSQHVVSSIFTPRAVSSSRELSSTLSDESAWRHLGRCCIR
eukprot:6189155-Pleurochrysis_carterae.AAC.2